MSADVDELLCFFDTHSFSWYRFSFFLALLSCMKGGG
jgi:hypothetical protein